MNPAHDPVAVVGVVAVASEIARPIFEFDADALGGKPFESAIDACNHGRLVSMAGGFAKPRPVGSMPIVQWVLSQLALSERSRGFSCEARAIDVVRFGST